MTYLFDSKAKIVATDPYLAEVVRYIADHPGEKFCIAVKTLGTLELMRSIFPGFEVLYPSGRNNIATQINKLVEGRCTGLVALAQTIETGWRDKRVVMLSTYAMTANRAIQFRHRSMDTSAPCYIPVIEMSRLPLRQRIAVWLRCLRYKLSKGK